MPASGEALLDQVQRSALRCFLDAVPPVHGLVADNGRAGAPCSIAGLGFALACYVVGVERKLLARSQAASWTAAALRFLAGSVQSEAPDATGHHGFYYHFLDMETGRRAWSSELSLIDSGFLLAGVLTASAYYDGESEVEAEIRSLAAALYERAEWTWACNGRRAISHGWKPEGGFLHYGWEGYSEAILLYVLALGSPSNPLGEDSYRAWTSTYQWENVYGEDVLYAGPLFIHQYSHLWIDFRGIQDRFMREAGSDYFENSRRAAAIQRRYALHNPRSHESYGPNCWGLSASDGPGPGPGSIQGARCQFLGYAARGVPHGPDDGTLSPAAAVACLPFAPEIVLPLLVNLASAHPETMSERGLRAFNASYRSEPDAGPRGRLAGWVCDTVFAIDQGALVLMIENYRTGLIWKLMKERKEIVSGLRRAGFRNGWLD